MTPSAIKLPWSSCRGHLKQESLVLNCLPDGGAYDVTRWDQKPYVARGDDYVPFFKTGT